jgi:phosphatidylglycerol---prolipoprotein diacylglyceryl transferase
MLMHPQFDPVALSLGPVQIHWYGLTYLVAFGLFLWLAALRCGSRSSRRPAGRGATSRTCCSTACSAW